MSVVERDHITALMRDDSPNKPFSRPDNLFGKSIKEKENISVDVYGSLKVVVLNVKFVLFY